MLNPTHLCTNQTQDFRLRTSVYAVDKCVDSHPVGSATSFASQANKCPQHCCCFEPTTCDKKGLRRGVPRCAWDRRGRFPKFTAHKASLHLSSRFTYR